MHDLDLVFPILARILVYSSPDFCPGLALFDK